MSSSCTNGRVEDSGSPAQLQTESKLYRHLLYTEFNEYATGEIEGVPMNNAEAIARAARPGDGRLASA